ncbi:MAG: RnfABCDGE type electron transport complex subunit B [Candidatus Aureabacteria bacterium]|nr:RnfABCDGE type electron transport complex subunit B [Candidatus Auribacterota bacterium]
MENVFAILLPIFTVAGLGLVFGFVLSFASKRFAPEINETEEKLFELLPGVNCGACGYAGCQAYGKAIIKSKEEINKCPVGGDELVGKIAKLMGVDASSALKQFAAVHCQGGKNTFSKAAYLGINTCAGEALTTPNRGACEWGCLGYGDCVKVCDFDAIHMSEDGYPVVDIDKCTACGKCVKACPRAVITLIPKTQKIYLGCRNPQKGKIVKDVCSHGCIGCRMCSLPKFTPSGKVKMKGNLPEIPSDWDDYEISVQKCPGKCFVVMEDIKTFSYETVSP